MGNKIPYNDWLHVVRGIMLSINHPTNLCPKSWRSLYDDGYSPFKAVSENEFDGQLSYSKYLKLKNATERTDNKA